MARWRHLAIVQFLETSLPVDIGLHIEVTGKARIHGCLYAPYICLGCILQGLDQALPALILHGGTSIEQIVAAHYGIAQMGVVCREVKSKIGTETL